VIRESAAATGGAFLALAVAAALAAAAEPAAHSHKPETAAQAPLVSPYVGEGDARATGLLPEEVEGLAKGSGMAMALPAELNGYPGPRHVLDAADAGQLPLRPEQREAVQRLYDRMLAEAKAKGQEILQAEASLARRFRHAHIDEATLREALERIGRLRADLRFFHLRTHLETKALLTPEQIARYNAVRGYDVPAGGSEQHKH
jgi:Spy/CpxP family protein refolding chaperone